MRIIRQPRLWWLLAVFVLGVLLVSASCSDDDDTPPSDGTPGSETGTPVASGSPTATPEILTREQVLQKDPNATEEGEVTWGALFELSGSWAQFGGPTYDGLQLAVKEINDAGGFQVGDTIYTIRIVESDTHSDVQQTIAGATELVRDEGVNVVWGPATLAETEATQITQPGHVLHLCPCQEREVNALSSVEKAHGESKWAFQTLLPFSILIGQGARNFVEDYPDFDTMALLCVNTQTGHDICGRTAEAYRNVGIEVTDEEYFPELTTNYTPYLTRIKEHDPDYLFNFNDPFQQAGLVRQAIEQEVGRLHIVQLPANVVEDLIQIPLTVPVTAGAAPRQHVIPQTQEAADYFDRYRAFLGKDNLPLAAFTSLLVYDHVFMLVAAMQQAGTVDNTTAIADALEQIHYAGVAEDDMFFNSRHLGIHGTEPCVVEAGKDIRCWHVPPPPEAYE